jgi:hypothetical protein
MITSYRNADLNEVIPSLLARKRQQHAEKYASKLKVFYFLAARVPREVERIRDRTIYDSMRDGEIAVVCASYGRKDGLGEAKRIVTKGTDLVLDLSNQYFGE